MVNLRYRCLLWEEAKGADSEIRFEKTPDLHNLGLSNKLSDLDTTSPYKPWDKIEPKISVEDQENEDSDKENVLDTSLDELANLFDKQKRDNSIQPFGHELDNNNKEEGGEEKEEEGGKGTESPKRLKVFLLPKMLDKISIGNQERGSKRIY